MTDSIENSVASISLSEKDASQDLVASVYAGPTDASIADIKHIFTSPTPKELESLENHLNDISTTLTLIQRLGDTKPLLLKLTKDQSLTYLAHLRHALPQTPGFTLQLIDSFVNNFQYLLSEITPTISSITPYITHGIVTMTLIKFYALFHERSTPVLEDQLEILSLQSKYVASFKLMTLMFQLDKESAVKVFRMESLQLLLSQVGANQSKDIIREGLLLLSVACFDDALRKEVSDKYLDLLIAGASINDDEIKSLAALVIVKTWDFGSLEKKHALSLDDLIDIFVGKLTEYSVEGLAYLSIKASVRNRLRGDEGFVFDLTKMLEDPPTNTAYGILVLLANLTTIEEKNEINELRKQANKGLGDDVEECEDEIEEFTTELMELNAVSKICSMSKISKTSMNQVITILHNFSRKRNNHAEIIKQGGLVRVLDFLGREEEPTEPKKMAYRALSTLLITSNPELVFNKYSPRSAINFLFQFLGMDSTSLKEQFTSLLALTNLAIMDSGRLTSAQWDTIDELLMQENPLLRRATLELISNLMQQKTNLPDMFDPQNTMAKRRYDLVVKLMKLDDIKSQCSAVAALSLAVSFPFISQELEKDEVLVENLEYLLKEQPEDEALMERVLFVLYNVVHNSESVEKFGALRDGCAVVLKDNKSAEVKEMAKELVQMLS